jgi:hypothetical protein
MSPFLPFLHFSYPVLYCFISLCTSLISSHIYRAWKMLNENMYNELKHFWRCKVTRTINKVQFPVYLYDIMRLRVKAYIQAKGQQDTQLNLSWRLTKWTKTVQAREMKPGPTIHFAPVSYIYTSNTIVPLKMRQVVSHWSRIYKHV